MEKRLYRKRWITALTACFAINIVEIIACNLPLLDMFRRGLLSTAEFNENIITGDFHTPLQYGVVQLVIYLFFIGYVVNNISVQDMIRYTYRKKYWKNQFVKTVITTGAFVLLHELMSVAFLIMFGNVEILIRHKWIQGALFQIFSVILYYLFAYFLYEILRSYMGQNRALIITIILCAVAYYCSFKFFENIWLPIDDVSLMGNLCTGIYSEKQCWLALLRLSETVILFCILFFRIKDKEDLLIYEKR